MQLYVRELKSQESGYSGNTPNQRGKYILIPSWLWTSPFFPALSQQVFNDSTPLIFHDQGAQLAATYVWHNAKFFLGQPGVGKRDHNERRIYRSAELDSRLNLDRGVVVVFALSSNGNLLVTSVVPNDTEYSFWQALSADQEQNLKAPIDVSVNAQIQRTRAYARLRTSSSTQQSPQLPFGAISVGAQLVTQQKNRIRAQQPAALGDPSMVVHSLIKNQKDFSDYVNQMYGGKCALRGSSLIDSTSTGLDACHLQDHSAGGPMTPCNGVLMSKDLHFCYDQGAFTINHSSKVEVNGLVPSGSKLWTFHGKEVKPVSAFSVWTPYTDYIDWHRAEKFDRFTL